MTSNWRKVHCSEIIHSPWIRFHGVLPSPPHLTPVSSEYPSARLGQDSGRHRRPPHERHLENHSGQKANQRTPRNRVHLRETGGTRFVCSLLSLEIYWMDSANAKELSTIYTCVDVGRIVKRERWNWNKDCCIQDEAADSQKKSPHLCDLNLAGLGPVPNYTRIQQR